MKRVTKKKIRKIESLIPLIVIIILMTIAYFLGFFEYLNFETLKMYHHYLKQQVALYPVISVFVYIGVYFFVVLLSIPVAIFLSMIGGFLFNQPFALLYVLIGATLGACGIFLAAKTALNSFLKKKAGSRLKRMEKGFKKDAVSYLLFLRFMPFPFWLVNLAPAFFNVSLKTFFWTTVVGIIPSSFISTQLGRGLSVVFEQEVFSIGILFNWHIRFALMGLGIIALIPVLVREFKKHA
jgi:uncharacterized membrane protein YdjX (TVP38/TMEM64 family)